MKGTLRRLRDEQQRLNSLLEHGDDLIADGEADRGAQLTISSLRARYSQLETSIAAERRRNGIASATFRFGGPRIRNGSMELASLGRLLDKSQLLVHALGQSLAGEASPKGRVAAHICEATTLRLAGMGRGSVQIDLVGDTGQQTTEAGSLLEDSLFAFHDLLEARDDRESLSALLRRYGYRVHAKYRDFLAFIPTAEVDFGLTSWTREVRRRESAIHLEDIPPVVNVLDDLRENHQETITVRGMLGGVMQGRRDFELVEDHTGKTYIGKIGDDALEAARMHFDNHVEATLRVEYDSAEDAELRQRLTLTQVYDAAGPRQARQPRLTAAEE